jgi:hypothetical protein
MLGDRLWHTKWHTLYVKEILVDGREIAKKTKKKAADGCAFHFYSYLCRKIHLTNLKQQT